MQPARFGISTHLYHDKRLGRAHLAEIAAAGFERLELFATRTHFDYHDAAAVADLDGWLRETGLDLHSIHAPVVEGLVGGQWGPPFSNASPDESARQRAVHETDRALDIARKISVRFLVVHLGVPDAQTDRGGNQRDAARRSLEDIQRLAEPLGVRLALEVIPNAMSGAGALVTTIEEDLELPDCGICMDFGHAFLMGDLVDAIEAASGHITTTHIHDNRGRSDDHLMPFDGAIDWAAAFTALQKVGYEGALMFEVANTNTPPAVLEKARQARRRFEQILGE